MNAPSELIEAYEQYANQTYRRKALIKVGREEIPAGFVFESGMGSWKNQPRRRKFVKKDFLPEGIGMAWGWETGDYRHLFHLWYPGGLERALVEELTEEHLPGAEPEKRLCDSYSFAREGYRLLEVVPEPAVLVLTPVHTRLPNNFPGYEFLEGQKLIADMAYKEQMRKAG